MIRFDVGSKSAASMCRKNLRRPKVPWPTTMKAASPPETISNVFTTLGRRLGRQPHAVGVGSATEKSAHLAGECLEKCLRLQVCQCLFAVPLSHMHPANAVGGHVDAVAEFPPQGRVRINRRDKFFHPRQSWPLITVVIVLNQNAVYETRPLIVR